jgi:hypothetical protein
LMIERAESLKLNETMNSFTILHFLPFFLHWSFSFLHWEKTATMEVGWWVIVGCCWEVCKLVKFRLSY